MIYLAKVEIKLKENAKNNPIHGLRSVDLDFFINGIEIDKLKSFQLEFAEGDINVGKCEFYIDDIDVDSEILLELIAIAKSKDDLHERQRKTVD